MPALSTGGSAASRFDTEQPPGTSATPGDRPRLVSDAGRDRGLGRCVRRLVARRVGRAKRGPPIFAAMPVGLTPAAFDPPYDLFSHTLSQALQVGDQVVELLVGELARAAGDGVGVVRAGEGVAEGLRPAVVEVGVLVVDAAERRGIVSPVGVVALLQAGDVDLAVGELGAVVAGVARGLGRAEDVLPAPRGRRSGCRPAAGRGCAGIRGCRGRPPAPSRRPSTGGGLACSW